ncbi:uncharacterized protein ASPGLDRAFT_67989 [Aspergillus glaucus CBS 516.65]|uniref:AB hydrolase-1 domain-containing protein n=1 Tax=Aspergillus glaucus CBS 516.65 TaxID=1160497 RepID=A0A1L9VF90_ASPGL|nr:hypothetical protein ASPGLDRAFT_67989 [Aspergillus glaucus CBS 516.65]OJJ82563.1 hypothetical protein ASPGLDRAFT_67989 [Aspergillus glaucus CBS 516.65]
MSFPFHIAEHVIDGQYIREYPRATATPDAPLKLCIKQYTPELYEPLWEELLAHSKQDGVCSIWIADAANQGASGIINEKNLGNDPSWYDHSRDVIHMINHFRDQMPRPIMGVGSLPLIHPRLFASLVLIEPHITDNPLAGDGPLFVAMSTKKRDVWPSREAAAIQYRNLLKAWNPRVFQLWKEFGYRALPTAVYPEGPTDGSCPVTLTTTKHEENNNQAYTDPKSSEARPPHDPLLVPDMLGPLRPGQRSYHPESILAYKLVPHIRPSVLYVSASHSPLGKGGEHADTAKRTGTGFGGSGGMEAGRVPYVMIQKAGHTLPQEKVAYTAQTMGPWIKQELQRWQQDEARIAEGWKERPTSEKSSFPSEWKEVIKSLHLPKRQAKI